MTIGIIGAMEEEVALLKQQMDVITAKNIIGIDFIMGKMRGKSVVIARCGIGKVNAAICTQVMIDLYGVDYVINTGVAGAIWKELNVGDIVISSDLVHHDFDTTAFGNPIGVIPRLSDSFFKADEELIRMAQNASAVLTDNKLYLGRISTGDQFVSDSAHKRRIWDTLGAYCTEMEGAAIAQTCCLNRIPFIVIRAISDKADGDAVQNFSEFVSTAAKNASAIIKEIVERL